MDLKKISKHPVTGAPVFYIKETVSTMLEVKKLLKAKEQNDGNLLPGASRKDMQYNSDTILHGTTVFAGYQSKGRGRLPERVWIAEPLSSLLCSTVLKPEKSGRQLSRIPVLLGLAVCKSIEQYAGLPCRIKWPNDVLVNGKKIAGVIAESRQNVVITGIGINCTQKNFPESLKAASIKTAFEQQKAGGRDGMFCREINSDREQVQTDPQKLLMVLLEKIEQVLSDTNWKDKAEQLLYGMECTVSLCRGIPHAGNGETPKKNEKGIIKGLGNDGSLLFKPLNGWNVERIYSGEIDYTE